MTMADVNVGIARNLAKAFIKRATELGYKGKKRDDAALNYFVGAAVLAELQGNNILYQHLGRLAGFLIAIHGYAAVKDIAKRQPKKE